MEKQAQSCVVFSCFMGTLHRHGYIPSSNTKSTPKHEQRQENKNKNLG